MTYTNDQTPATRGRQQNPTQAAINAQLATCPVVAATTANVMASTIAADGGSSVPTHNARRDRDSGRPACSNAAARRAINQRVSTTAQLITAAIAARLASTLSSAAASATIQFSSVLRLMTSSRYRTRCTTAAAPNATAEMKNAVRTRSAGGACRRARSGPAS